eukprot:scaffold27439_cov85-Isochrysis_galbana.AAC.1
MSEAEEVISMDNGCACCTVRGDLVRVPFSPVKSIPPPHPHPLTLLNTAFPCAERQEHTPSFGPDQAPSFGPD